MLIRRLRRRFQVLGGIGMKCYQWSNSNALALVFIDSTIMCMLLKLGAKIKNRDVEKTMFHKISRLVVIHITLPPVYVGTFYG